MIHLHQKDTTTQHFVDNAENHNWFISFFIYNINFVQKVSLLNAGTVIHTSGVILLEVYHTVS